MDFLEGRGGEKGGSGSCQDCYCSGKGAGEADGEVFEDDKAMMSDVEF